MSKDIKVMLWMIKELQSLGRAWDRVFREVDKEALTRQERESKVDTIKIVGKEIENE